MDKAVSQGTQKDDNTDGPGAGPSRFRRIFWVSDIFRNEFGTSDVQANYSRVYVWMANQLGHMTLGLATTLLFVWIYETTFSAMTTLAYWRDAPGSSAARCGGDLLCWAGLGMLASVFVIVTLAVIAALLAQVVGIMRQDRAEVTTGYVPPARAVAIGLRLGVATGLIVVPVALQVAITDSGAVVHLAHLAGAAMALLMIAAGVVILCKDRQVLLIAGIALGIIALLGSGLLARGGSGDNGTEAGVTGGLLVLLALVTWRLRYADDDMAHLYRRGANCWRELAGLVVAVMFLLALANGLEAEWRWALTAAFASVTLWWVKEFGSDIPGVQDEIARAESRRPAAATPGDFDEVKRDYLNDARMDARTDGLFYIAGAWIGAGVISGSPVLSDTLWETGAELVGCLVFILIFLVEGRRWSLRQVALDMLGATRASRLAVFRSAIRMIEIPPEAEMHLEGDLPEVMTYDPTPITRLDWFARGVPVAPEDRLDHVFVVGALGSGRTPLGLAMASEAALASHSTISDTPEEGPARTARYVQFHRLSYLLRDVHNRRDVREHPTVPLAFDRASGAILPRGKAGPGAEVTPAASLVVIDDASDQMGITYASACEMLHLGTGTEAPEQQTVWIIPTDHADMVGELQGDAEQAAWRPDYRIFRRQILPLRAAIIAASGGRRPRIGIVFVKRYAAA